MQDFEPILIHRFAANGQSIAAREPLVFQPVLHPEGDLLMVENRSLGIDVFAPDRSRLMAALYEDLEVVWLEFANLPDHAPEPARRIRDALRARLAVASLPVTG